MKLTLISCLFVAAYVLMVNNVHGRSIYNVATDTDSCSAGIIQKCVNQQDGEKKVSVIDLGKADTRDACCRATKMVACLQKYDGGCTLVNTTAKKKLRTDATKSCEAAVYKYKCGLSDGAGIVIGSIVAFAIIFYFACVKNKDHHLIKSVIN